MIISFEKQGLEDYFYWQTQDKKTLKKLNSIILDISRNAFEGIGKPEPLKANLSGYWSRRIDLKNRIVYQVTNDSIIIHSCKLHYEN
jgi:toxin YoeB